MVADIVMSVAFEKVFVPQFTKVISAERLLHHNVRSCGCETGSIGENIIYTYLEDHNINFDSQKRFDDCKYKQFLPFDFYLPDYNVCIEYQGEQHYKPVDFSYTPTEESKQKAIKKFEDGQKRDRVKKDYCKEKGIYLLEISYKDKKRLSEILDSFFNNFNRNSNDCHT